MLQISICLPALLGSLPNSAGKEKTMRKRSYLFVLVPMLLSVGLANAQESYPIMEKIVQKVLEKYQNFSCQQLAQEKSHPPTGEKAQMEQRAVQVLRNDPQMRTAFINQVAAPIANKLFECGMIP
jgi:electron transfer flavoprotein alpha/beta subunit